MLHLTYAQIKAINEVFRRLNKLRRWTNLVSKRTFNELNKQALNCIVCYILACYVEKAGKKSLVWKRFPRIALYRAFQKVYVVFNTPEYKYEEIFELANLPMSEFTVITKEKIIQNSDKELADFICSAVGTYEEEIYKAATKIATYIELTGLSTQCSADVYSKKVVNIMKEIKEYEHIPGVKELSNTESELFKLLSFISSSGLRNHIRWCEVGYLQECSILGHLFDTGIFSYCISLEMDPADEELATQRFFMGIFHDIAEAWTTDIPSPIKDSIPGFREACESYEQKVLEENLYSKVPSFLSKKLREVMFEDPANAEKHKAVIKGGDYLSADSECWRQYVLGSRDPYFLGAMRRRIPGIESGKVALTPCCAKLFKFFMNYAEKLHLEELGEDPEE